ncbi:NAD(P)H-binding protein [Streptomyces sp. NPDC052301]|uniref:NAD(P)H-binding protein n=1 Tax=Streptomyces sp. NPDC052301 TaxID=3365687 RepID=UPI0037D4B324
MAEELGHRVTTALVGRGVEVRVLLPAPDAPVTPGVRAVHGDLRDPGALRCEAEGCGVVLVLPGPVAGQVQAQNAAVDMAADIGARLVKVSCWGPAVREDSADPGARRDWINKQYLRRRDLPHTVLFPNRSMQQLVDRHAGSVRRSGLLPDPSGGHRVSLVDLADVAEAVVRVLTEDGHEGREYVLSGPSAPTYPEIARLLTDLTGREVECPEAPGGEEGVPEPWRDGAWEQITDTLPLLLRRPSRDIGDFLRANIRHFVPDGSGGPGPREGSRR